MINLDELIYSYKYIKGMVRRIEKDLDDNDVDKDKAREFRDNI